MKIDVDLLSKIATATGILAGFSLTATVKLVSDLLIPTNTERAMLRKLAAVILLCTTLLLAGVFVSAAVLSSRAAFIATASESQRIALYTLINFTMILFFLGMLSFFVGTALTAWILHKTIGIIVSCVAAVSYAWMLYVFFSAP